MFLPEFSSTDIQRNSKKVFEAANKEPVLITRMGSKSVVMLSKEAYAKLVKGAK